MPFRHLPRVQEYAIAVAPGAGGGLAYHTYFIGAKSRSSFQDSTGDLVSSIIESINSVYKGRCRIIPILLLLSFVDIENIHACFCSRENETCVKRFSSLISLFLSSCAI